MKRGMINHLAISVDGLSLSKLFYDDLLARLDNQFMEDIPEDNSKQDSYFGAALWENLRMNKFINLWQKRPTKASDYDHYAIGLHHFAFFIESEEEVDKLYDWVKTPSKGQILDRPDKYEHYGPGYYAFYFKELNGFKIDIVTHNTQNFRNFSKKLREYLELVTNLLTHQSKKLLSAVTQKEIFRQ